jgi:hypothetical protein
VDHDLRKEFKGARGRLDRNDPKFFQRDPSPQSSCDASTEDERCVTYQMKVNVAFNVPTPTATSTPSIVPDALHDALGEGAIITRRGVPVFMVAALSATSPEDARRNALLEPVPVARVDLSHRAYYEPMRATASGGTAFVSPGGRCVDDCTGRIVPVPSLCDPDADPSPCPPESRCRRGGGVVTMDLATDRDGDEIPDAVRPPPSQRVAAQ